MKDKLKILPGNPNDDNRDYLPMAIKDTKNTCMVVNENGNNSQVYPERLKEYKEPIGDGIDYIWYEYIPESYDGTKKVPLVLSMHGGLMTGWGQAIYTSWTMVAEREGFIVVFPNAQKNRMWVLQADDKVREAMKTPMNGFTPHIPPIDPAENDDMNLTVELIEKMKSKYNIDEGRIFMQGMSMGNAMTSQFARYHGKLLAGKAGSAGPTYPGLLFDEEGEILYSAGPLAVWQSRMELDSGGPPFFDGDDTKIVKTNRDYWKQINKCEDLPQIKITGEDNLVFYKGEYADIVFRDVKNRDHGQTLDDAELVWDYLFSGISRNEKGEIINGETILPREGDKYAIAVADGRAKAYLNNKLVELSGPVFIHKKLKYHGLDGDAKVRGEYFMAPVSFVAKALGADISKSEGGSVAEITLKDGRHMQFARGIIGCAVDSKVCSMLCEAVLRDGELYVPIEWVFQKMLDNHVSRCDGVIYITDHYSELSHNVAEIIRDEILA